MVDRPDAVARVRADIETLERAYSPGHHGVWAARRRADLVDGALRDLFERAGAPPHTAVAAVGGYGRDLLLPRSDVDLLILHDGPDQDSVARLADAVLYPLWNEGFEVGHAVRTPAACEEACDRLDAAASMLDLRPVAGDLGLVEDVADRVRRRVRRGVEAFVTAIRDDATRRADRFGSTSHLLEPDLKDGAGGWRDLHSIWLIEIVLGTRLEDAGLLRGRERDALASAEEYLVRLRSALHLETRRRADRLVLDHQPEIARAMGFEDEPRLPAIDGLMRSLFEHARQVEFLLRAVTNRFASSSGERSSSALAPPTTPTAVLDALAAEAAAGREPPAALLDAIDDADLPTEVDWTDDVRRAFLDLLRTGQGAARSLEVLDRLDLLGRFLPEWRDVRCRPQRDPYHRFTVDAHLTATLRRMSEFLAGVGDDEDPVQAEAAGQVVDRDALLLGALLHDIGKIGEGGHVAVGVRTVDAILERTGIDGELAERVRFLVEQHLLLSDTATRRDLTDENLIVDVAAAVGTSERLAALYLLARADADATGPAAWTPWRRTLIHELVAKVQHVLEGEMGADLVAELGRRVDRVRALLEGEPDRDVETFVNRMPRGYLLAVEPERVARHFATISPPVGTTEVRAVHRPGTRPGTSELLVVARDRPGLLSWIAGALSLAGLSILTAQVFTTEDGVAADLFEVEGVWEPDVPERRWREFRADLRRAVTGSISLEARVDEKRRWYPAPRDPAPVTIAIDNGASDFATVIEVGAPDRLGLLFDVTRTLADLGLDVHLAKVATYEGRVVDAFYVRDGLGRKVVDDAPDVERVLRDRLTARLEGVSADSG